MPERESRGGPADVPQGPGALNDSSAEEEEPGHEDRPTLQRPHYPAGQIPLTLLRECYTPLPRTRAWQTSSPNSVSPREAADLREILRHRVCQVYLQTPVRNCNHPDLIKQGNERPPGPSHTYPKPPPAPWAASATIRGDPAGSADPLLLAAHPLSHATLPRRQSPAASHRGHVSAPQAT